MFFRKYGYILLIDHPEQLTTDGEVSKQEALVSKLYPGLLEMQQLITRSRVSFEDGSNPGALSYSRRLLEKLPFTYAVLMIERSPKSEDWMSIAEFRCKNGVTSVKELNLFTLQP